MVDCWCCFPNFGVSKKFERGHDIDVRDEDLGGKMREREPLLGKGPRPNSTSCSHSRYIASASGNVAGTMPSEGSGLGSDASRNPLSDILLSLNAGKVPSQNQVSEVLRKILSSGVLDVQQPEASEQEGAPESEPCRTLIGDTQELVQAFLDFGVQKNGDNKLQDIYYSLMSLMKPVGYGKPSGGKEDVSPGVDIKETGLEVKSSELEFDTSTLLSACRTLVLTFIASNSFRRALSNLVSIVTHDVQTDKSNAYLKENVLNSIREIIERIQKDSASRCAMRAILILLRKYGHVLSTTPASPSTGPEIVIEFDIPEPLSGLLKNMKEILERCAGGKSLDPVLSAFIRAMRNLSDDEQGNGDAAFCVPPIVLEERTEKIVESPEDDATVPVPMPVYTATPKPAANPVQISPSPPAPTANGNGNSIGNDQKKPNSRNKKAQKAKMKKKQKALEKKDQELKNGSGEGPAASAQNNGEVKPEEKDTDPSTSIKSTKIPIQTSSPAKVEVNPSQTTQHYSGSSSTQKPEVSLSAFFQRVGRFLDSLLSESEFEHEGDSSGKEKQEEDDTGVKEGTEHIDIEELVDDAQQLFADTTDSPETHTLLAEVRHFTHALESDDTLARLCKAANAFSRDIHLLWASESSSGLSQVLLKRLLRVLPLPLPLPLNCVPSPLSNTSSLPSRSAFQASHNPDVELKMGNCEGTLTDLWVCRRSSPTMVGEGEGRRNDWKWLMEGAKVIEVSVMERKGHDEGDDTNAHYAHDANSDSETTTLLSSTKSRSSVTYTNGSTSAVHSNPRRSHNFYPNTRMPQRVRLRIRVPLTNLPNHNHSPLHLHAGMENVRYSVRDVGPCGAWVGYEDEGVLDVEFGSGDIGVDGEVDVDVDLGFEEEKGEGLQDDGGGSPSHPSSPSFESQASTMTALQHDGNGSLVIPEIIVIDESADEDIKANARTEDEASSRVPESRHPQRNLKGKARGKQRLKSLQVLSTTTVPQNRFAICNEEDIRIDVTRRESTRHHWPITDMLISPFSGSRGVLVEQMVRHAVKTWVKGTLEERAKDAVEEWLAGFVGGCEWLWGGLDEIFREDVMC